MPGARFFPEGVAIDQAGNLYAGSLEYGSIVRVKPSQSHARAFIPPGANSMVSVLGVYADSARGTLWACSSDAGNAPLKGTGSAGLKSFDLQSGQPTGSYDLPGGGFCNDLTIDARGNVYTTDSWRPRILRLAAGGTRLETWIDDPGLGSDQWSLNGIAIDRSNLYVVNQLRGQLFRIAIRGDGAAGDVTPIATSRPLRRPDGLKVLEAGKLATAEGGAGDLSILTLSSDADDRAEVRRLGLTLDGVSTFAVDGDSVWILEGQSDHFWDPTNAGPNADPPFRIVRVPLPVQSMLRPRPMALMERRTKCQNQSS